MEAESSTSEEVQRAERKFKLYDPWRVIYYWEKLARGEEVFFDGTNLWFVKTVQVLEPGVIQVTLTAESPNP